MALLIDDGGPASTQPKRRPAASPASAPTAVTSRAPAFNPQAVADARAQLMQLLTLDNTESESFIGSGAAEYMSPERGIVGTQSLYEADVDKAQKTLSDALALQRDAAVETPAGPMERPAADGKVKPAEIEDQTRELTWDRYNNLSPLKRSAVDFNTALVRAVERDARLQDKYDPTEQEQLNYDTSIEKIFGEGGGSKQFAPETLALLQQIDFKDTAADLDEFLNLDVAIRGKDLKGLTDFTPPPVVRGETPATVRQDVVRDLAGDTQRMQELLVKGNTMLQTMKATSIDARNPTVEMLGGQAKAPAQMTGYGSPTAMDATGGQTASLDGHFQRAFDLLARRGSDRDALMAKLAQGANPGEMDAFLKYVDARSRNSQQYGIDLGGPEGGKYLSPEEFRVKLGLEQGGADDGR
jgi:hypothetical protein